MHNLKHFFDIIGLIYIYDRLGICGLLISTYYIDNLQRCMHSPMLTCVAVV